MPISLPKPLENETIPSPLLLIGATRDHVIELCQRLLGVEHHAKIESGNHPDLRLIQPEGKSRLHALETMRRMIAEMRVPPFEAAEKIFVLFEAERMLPTAANALLKTLEEPPEDTRLLLVTDHPKRILPTALSRLCPVPFPPSKTGKSFDLSPLVALAEQGQWDIILEKLQDLDEEDPAVVFDAFLHLHAVESSPKYFLQTVKYVDEGLRAIDHSLSVRNVLLHLLLVYRHQLRRV